MSEYRRFVVVVVNRHNGDAVTYGPYEGPDAADVAWVLATENTDEEHACAFVVGLKEEEPSYTDADGDLNAAGEQYLINIRTRKEERTS